MAETEAVANNGRICHHDDVPMTSMNISLPDELKEYVEKQSNGRYSTPSEFVRELIREDQKRRAEARLEQLLLEGLDSGEPIPADAKFWADLKQEALERFASRRARAAKTGK